MDLETSGNWRSIPGYTGYAISEAGGVIDIRRDPPMLVQRESTPGYPNPIVRLVADGAFRPHPVRVDELMESAFLVRPANYDLYKLVHIDGNPGNCRVDNYGWARKETLPLRKKDDV